MLNENRKAIETEVINKVNNGEKFDYKFYATVSRKRWVDWGKTKFINFIVKHAGAIHTLDYEMNMDLMTPRAYQTYLKNVIKQINKKDYEFHTYLKEVFNEQSYWSATEEHRNEALEKTKANFKILLSKTIEELETDVEKII